MILNFSLRHNLHLFVIGLNTGMFLSKNFQVTLGALPACISFQKYFDMEVWPFNINCQGYAYELENIMLPSKEIGYDVA